MPKDMRKQYLTAQTVGFLKGLNHGALFSLGIEFLSSSKMFSCSVIFHSTFYTHYITVFI